MALGSLMNLYDFIGYDDKLEIDERINSVTLTFDANTCKEKSMKLLILYLKCFKPIAN